jgi:hypothetical protein
MADLAPNGKRFAVLLEPPSPGSPQTQNHVTLVLHFFDELRRRFSAAAK